MIKVAEGFETGTAPSRNPEYRKLENRKAKANSTLEKVKLHKLLLCTPSKTAIDEKFKRLSYIRYADD